MSATTVRFNVGGTVFEVAVSTIQSQPEGLLAKMIDGRFPSGKDERGAFFVDRHPRFFDIVLDVHRDNKVYPLTPVFTRERVLAELEFYGLQDFCEDAAIDLSFQSTVRSLQDSLRGVQEAACDFSRWQQEQKSLGANMLAEAVARLCLAEAKLDKEVSPATFTIPALNLATSTQTLGVTGTVIPSANAGLARQIVKLFETWDMQATVSPGVKSRSDSTITLQPARPDATAEQAKPEAGA